MKIGMIGLLNLRSQGCESVNGFLNGLFHVLGINGDGLDIGSVIEDYIAVDENFYLLLNELGISIYNRYEEDALYLKDEFGNIFSVYACTNINRYDPELDEEVFVDFNTLELEEVAEECTNEN